MGFPILKSVFFGMVLGLYYGEKSLPWPILYLHKPNRVGDIKIDFSVVNQLADDLAKLMQGVYAQ